MMSTNQVYHISGLLEKMTNVDKDFRYMAVNDLMAELSKQSITLDEDMEKRIVRALLMLIQDKNGEVQNLACRCLGPLVHKIKVPQLEILIDALCANMASSQNEQLRDVSSIALKTVLGELPSGSITTQMFTCVRRVVPKLIEALKTDYKGNSSVKLEVLDILSTLIQRYGRTVNLMFEEIETILFLQLEKERQTMRKRAISTLGYLADVVGEEQFDRIVGKVHQMCTDPDIDVGTLKTFIMAAISICRTSAARFSKFLPGIVAILIQKSKSKEDDELSEICLQAFEIFVFRCTNEMTPFVPQVTAISSQMITYDPNYNYGPEDEGSAEEMEVEGASEDEADEEEENGYSDDDDLSWKIRRAAAKCIEALITFRAEELSQNINTFGPLLINRFREREDNVRLDVFASYSSLLKLARQVVPELAAFQSQNPQGGNEMVIETFSPEHFQRVLSELNEEQKNVFGKLATQVPTLMRALQRHLHGKNLRTRLNAFHLLSHLVRAFPGVITPYLGSLVNDISATLADTAADGGMKIDVLRFASLVLVTHDPQELNQFVGVLVPLLANVVGDQFYKIAGEALLTTQSLLHVLHAQKLAGLDMTGKLPVIYSAVISKLRIADIDQEVKEKNIATAGLLISMFADELGPKIVDECFPLLLERLRNEMTRLVTLRAMNLIIRSPVKLDLQAALPDLLSLSAEFLRKNQRSLRLSTLTLLESLVFRHSHNGLQGSGLIKVVKEIPVLISEQDLQISLIAVTFITNVVNYYPDQIQAESLSNLFKSLILLIHSSLLQGATLNATLSLLTALIRSPLPNKPTFEQILERISEPVYAPNASLQLMHRQAYASIAKATAVVAQATADPQKSTQLILQLRDAFRNATKQNNDSVRLFAIFTLGELGRSCKAAIEASENDVQVELLIIEAFGSQLEEIKSAASYALGSLAAGNLAKYLPFLLSEIVKEEKKQYLFLHALKEVINSECDERGTLADADETFRQGTEQIWAILMKYCDSNEESIRSIVAECIGRLIMVNPQLYVSQLLAQSKSPSANVRSTTITALRFIIVEQPIPVDEYLRPVMGQFLNLVRDEDMNVRRVTIVTLNSAAHNKPKLIKDCLSDLLPALYEETKVKEELVHEVEMGPFKHIVDDGLDLRKAAFECMYTLADHSLDRVNLNDYLNYVENGLKDQHDIKLLTYLMLTRLVRKCPIQMAQRVDSFCEHIKPQLLLRPKQNAVKQENDKQDELKRSAVRTVIALRRVPNSDRSQKMLDLWEIINSNPDLTSMKEAQTREQQLWSINGFETAHEAMDVE